MTAEPQQHTQQFVEIFDRIVANVGQAIRGKIEVVRLAWICLLAEGHLLIEDIPGTGKTSLARAMAQSVAGTWKRIQFTPDLLPSDVVGFTAYDQSSGRFYFRAGPVFSTILLADEINRASPKTQSALLEVMEESRVTVDGVTHEVGSPFMVIATQNSVEKAGGIYALPEAQLDRFLMRTALGPPDRQTMIQLLVDARTKAETLVLEPVVNAEELNAMIAYAGRVTVDPSILAYVVALAEATRADEDVALGVSTRGCLAMTRAAKAKAATEGRLYATPDDIKELLVPVWAHRLLMSPDAEFAGTTGEEVLVRLRSQIPPPTGR